MEKPTSRSFAIIGIILLSLGYVWWFSFSNSYHMLVKYLTMQSYFVAWLYFLLLALGTRSDRLFSLNFALQIMVTGGYWLLIHRHLVETKTFSCMGLCLPRVGDELEHLHPYGANAVAYTG